MIHPDGAAATSGQIPLTDLGDTSNLYRLVEAFGGYGGMVDRSEDLAPALGRALDEVVNQGRQAVLNVMTAQR